MSDIKFTAGLDFKQAESDLAKFKPKKPITLEVDATIDDVLAKFEKLTSLDIDIDADVSEAQSELNSLESPKLKLEVETPKIKPEVEKAEIELDNSDAKSKIAEIGDSLKDTLDQKYDVGGILALGSGVGLATKGIEILSDTIIGSIGDANEYNNALKDLQNVTGVTGETFEQLSAQIGDAYESGIGETLAETTKIIQDTQIKLGDVFDPTQLGEFVKGAGALGKTFDKDINEVISKATPFIKQFGLESEEAFNLLALSMKEGGTASDDILDSLAEYSQLASKAGFSAQEFTGLLTSGAKEGLFNTDKLADSIKEAEIRLKAGDFSNAFKGIKDSVPATQKALIDTIEAVAKAGQSGEISVKETLQKSTKLINEAFKSGDITESVASQLQVAIAGTPAEDIGTELFSKLFSAEIDTKQIDAQAQKIGENISATAGQYTTFDQVSRKISKEVTEALAGIIDFGDQVFKGLLDLFTNFVVPIFDGLKDGFTPLFDAFKGIYEQVVALFGVLGQLTGASESSISVMDILKGVLNGLGEVVGFVLEYFVKFVTFSATILVNTIGVVINIVRNVIEAFAKFVKENETLQSVIKGVSSVFKEIAKFLSENLSKAIEFITNKFTSLQKGINGLVGGIKSFLGIDDNKTEKSAEKTEKSIKKTTESVKELNKETAKDVKPKSIEAVKESSEKALLPLEKLQAELKKQEEQLQKAIFKENTADIEKYSKEVTTTKEKIKDFNDRYKELTETLEQTPIQILNSQLSELKKQFENQNTGLLTDDLRNLATEIIDVEKQIAQIKETEKKAFENVVAKTSFDEYENYLKQKTIADFERQNAITGLVDEEKGLYSELLESQEKTFDIMRENGLVLSDDYEDVFDILGELKRDDITSLVDYANAGMEILEIYGDSWGEYADNLSVVFDRVASLSQNNFQTTEDYLKGTIDALEIAKQGFDEQSSAYKAFAITQAIINTYLSANKALAEVPFPLNLAAVAVIIGAGLLNVGQIAGAESGVVGIDENYKGKVGKTDTIPLMVAKGESVVTAEGTKRNAKLIELMNKGYDISEYLSYKADLGNILSSNNITNTIDVSGIERALKTQNEILKTAKLVTTTANLTIIDKTEKGVIPRQGVLR